jgi:hypothetical protein
MFENIKDFNNIVVSGPQRSGTRIVSKAISSDINKEYIDEKEINFHDFRLLEYYLLKGNVVIQCPGLCHKLHEISTLSTLIVLVRRPVEEILKSEHRVGWTDLSRNQELYKYGYSSGIISKVKYEYWDKVQKFNLKVLCSEFDFHTIVGHPLYISDRNSFKWDQTS